MLLFYQDFNEQFEGYTQPLVSDDISVLGLFYQDFNEQFEGYTQPCYEDYKKVFRLFYQDFNEQFEGYTQQSNERIAQLQGCFIRISMNNLKDIHNCMTLQGDSASVVLSGFQ